jgi:hypothetical protein
MGARRRNAELVTECQVIVVRLLAEGDCLGGSSDRGERDRAGMAASAQAGRDVDTLEQCECLWGWPENASTSASPARNSSWPLTTSPPHRRLGHGDRLRIATTTTEQVAPADRRDPDDVLVTSAHSEAEASMLASSNEPML